MKSIETVSLIGLGALGSANLAKISESVPENIRVVASGERAERYRKRRICKRQDLHVPDLWA